ncbi:electron transfer flavoprotein-ubiquinone oxidoreductase [Candidatus Symbiobacter mobilis]|uniref:Electron transfer flavoprotein-ubiquinone oxidoreductase n=1 Tax=Candidatus Symbiobacter mobilis CR TaxID=946483 RepID=U5N6U8_9BURK|nr:electron transfer flavoprotein-ubiquinone oxidoreductase [Candidatus Symbiobacter mobilis]AGX87107.1 flavoprotein dehydrogenase [Candidatus Symbiobacter mobilis CR]
MPSTPPPLPERESMEYDLVIVGAGPAGLAAAIRAKQAAAQRGCELSVAVLEKGCEPGAHTLSGAVLDPRALTALLPDWKDCGAPLHQAVTEESMLFLGAQSARRVPDFLLPECSHNAGNYLVSLGALVRWMAKQAEALGVEIYPGYAASEVLYDQSDTVIGVATGDLGIAKDGTRKPNYQRGMALLGRYTLFAEGSRGHLGKALISHYQLDAGRDPQGYALGIKELWEAPPQRHQPGLLVHTTGWPLDNSTYGGCFLYHLADRRIAAGMILGLDYRNPHLDPFEEFQRWKTHPQIRQHFADETGKVCARRLSYGARSMTTGGWMSLPRTVFPGGALVGCDAGFLDSSRLKGIHSAMESAMMAADAAVDAVAQGRSSNLLSAYPEAIERSPLRQDLERSRNFKTWFQRGMLLGTLMNGLEQRVLRGSIPWTIHRKAPDHARLRPAQECTPPQYPKPDGQLTFDRASSVFLSRTHHEENQPCHLRLRNADTPVTTNLQRYAGPEARYCPAQVYEFHTDASGQTTLVINAINCLHCKTCDIKDPTQNIEWVTPEGGEGPLYLQM